MWRSEDKSLQFISFLPVHGLGVRVKVGTELRLLSLVVGTSPLPVVGTLLLTRSVNREAFLDLDRLT